MPSTGLPWAFGRVAPLSGHWEETQLTRFTGVATIIGHATGAQDADTGRRHVVGRPAAVNDAAPRGTVGLLPARWGTAIDVAVAEVPSDYELRTRSGRLIASGQTGGRLMLAALLRMPRSAAMPERGEAFSFVWRGRARIFVVWDVEPQWAVRNVRLVQLSARHELDLGDVYASPATHPEFSLP